MGAVKVGDYIRIVIEGPWDGSGEVLDYGVQPREDERTEWYANPGDVVTIEKIDPPVETFGPGDLVRGRDGGSVVALGLDGFFNLGSGEFFTYGQNGFYLTPEKFTSRRFKRVSVS